MDRLDDLPWTTVAGQIGYGGRSVAYRIQIFIDNKSSPGLPMADDNGDLTEIGAFFHKKGREIHQEIYKQLDLQDPVVQTRVKANIDQLKALFAEIIFAEEIPNEYHSDMPHRWLIVTTQVGRIKIGWRKRVINIDWSDSIVKFRAAELFPNEDVTKGDYYIHAGSYNMARAYLEIILATQGSLE